MTKAEIRKEYKQKRQQLSAAAKERAEDLMLIQFQNLGVAIPDYFMSYAPIASMNEYDPVLIEEYCFFKNPATTLIFPKVNFESNCIEAFAINEDTAFAANKYEIEEPVDAEKILPYNINLLFVPLLAFNEQGYRVGYGKGFYDRFIAECKNDLVKIGFSFFDAEVIDDVNSFDKKLDFCITPTQVYQF